MRQEYQNRIVVRGLPNGEVVRIENATDPHKHFEKFYLVGKRQDGRRFRRLITALPCHVGGARRFVEGARVKKGALRIALVACHKGFGICVPDATFKIFILDLL